MKAITMYILHERIPKHCVRNGRAVTAEENPGLHREKDPTQTCIYYCRQSNALLRQKAIATQTLQKSLDSALVVSRYSLKQKYLQLAFGFALKLQTKESTARLSFLMNTEKKNSSNVVSR